VDDAVADVFAVVWRKIDQAPDSPGALPWLYAIAYRVVFHHWRRTGRRHRLERKAARATGTHHVDTAELVIQHEDYRRVLSAAARLSETDQELLRLTLWEEVASSEAAQILGISANAVKQRIHRAKKRLAREFRSLTKAELPLELSREERPS
jgi:RNA polymerase sigma factor (sigma-70 family)